MRPHECDLVLKARVYARIAYRQYPQEDLYANAEEAIERLDDNASVAEVVSIYIKDALRLGFATEDDIRSMFQPISEEVLKLARE